jgi:hypothetical protein
MPYRVAADILKFRSDILQTRHLEIVRDERERLMSVLPPFLLEDGPLIEALQAVLSFDMWNQLRSDQGLSAQQAADVVNRILSRLLPETSLSDFCSL